MVLGRWSRDGRVKMLYFTANESNKSLKVSKVSVQNYVVQEIDPFNEAVPMDGVAEQSAAVPVNVTSSIRVS